MKYFDALDNVETEIVRLSEMRNLLAVLINGVDSSSREEIISAFHYIEGSISDISDQLLDEFLQLHYALASDKKDKK